MICRANKETRIFALRFLGKDEVKNFTLKDFLQAKIKFAGFVLHENGKRTSDDYLKADFYDEYNLDVDLINKNLKKIFGDEILGDYSITMFHFPIESKVGLIKKVILLAKEKVDSYYDKNI